MYKCKSVSDPAEKASLFNEFSSAVFIPNCVDLVGLQNDVVHSDLLMEESTTASEVQNILAKLDVSKATGADNIPARILREYSLKLSFDSLQHFFFVWFRRCGKELTLHLFSSLITRA